MDKAYLDFLEFSTVSWRPSSARSRSGSLTEAKSKSAVVDVIDKVAKRAKEASKDDKISLSPSARKALKEWVETNQAIQAITAQLSVLTARSNELEAQVLPIVKASEEQTVRVGNAILKYNGRKTGGRVSYSKVLAELLPALTEKQKKLLEKLKEAHTGDSGFSEYVELTIAKQTTKEGVSEGWSQIWDVSRKVISWLATIGSILVAIGTAVSAFERAIDNFTSSSKELKTAVAGGPLKPPATVDDSDEEEEEDA